MKLNPFGLILVCIISYLTYHAIAGKQGLARWTKMQAQADELEVLLKERLDYRRDLQQKISKLYPETLDLDLIEELARSKFHFVHSDEYMLEPPSLTAQLPENEELFDLSN